MITKVRTGFFLLTMALMLSTISFAQTGKKKPISNKSKSLAMGNTAVENKRWKLIELNGKTILGTAQTHYIIFHSQNGMLEAKAGCNQLSNSYVIKNNLQVTIKSGISTMMACLEPNIEKEFIEALTSADNISVNDTNLSLNKGRMAPLARFELIKKKSYNWLYGKTFVQVGVKTFDPVLGGPDFLEFKSKKIIELKTGDIVSRMKVTFEEDKIILEDQYLSVKRIFTIVKNSYLLDENGLEWRAK
jgi:heat shock protein HslJ